MSITNGYLRSRTNNRTGESQWVYYLMACVPYNPSDTVFFAAQDNGGLTEAEGVAVSALLNCGRNVGVKFETLAKATAFMERIEGARVDDDGNLIGAAANISH
jgi:hypothetical protein